MKTLGNILWHFPFFGFVTAGVTFLLGSLLTLSVIAAPIGLGLIQLSKLLLSPFGHEMVRTSDLNVQQNVAWKAYSGIVIVLYFPFGLLLVLTLIVQIAFLFISIIGIPVALVIAKSLGTYLNPVGKKCVSGAVKAELERRKAQGEIDKHLGGGNGLNAPVHEQGTDGISMQSIAPTALDNCESIRTAAIESTPGASIESEENSNNNLMFVIIAVAAIILIWASTTALKGKLSEEVEAYPAPMAAAPAPEPAAPPVFVAESTAPNNAGNMGFPNVQEENRFLHEKLAMQEQELQRQQQLLVQSQAAEDERERARIENNKALALERLNMVKQCGDNNFDCVRQHLEIARKLDPDNVEIDKSLTITNLVIILRECIQRRDARCVVASAGNLEKISPEKFDGLKNRMRQFVANGYSDSP